jgi:adenylosuccinate synthase
MHLEYGRTALFESAQGFDLSLNWGVKYPFVTSRDITIGSMINDAGICLQKVGDIYGSIRCHPIRVGNVKDKDGNITGFSGPHYTDQEELSWDEITKTCGAPQDIVERTTVTGKIRRVFSFSTMQLLRFLNHCGPTHMFVNFIEYLNWRDHGIKEYSLLSAEAKSFIVMMNSVVRPFGCKIAYVGTGEKNSDMVEMNHVA